MENLVINTAVLHKLGFVPAKRNDADLPWDWVFHDGYNQAPYGIIEIAGTEKEDRYLSRHYLDSAGMQIITLYDLYCSMSSEASYLLHILADRIEKERMSDWLIAEQEVADVVRISFKLSKDVMPSTIRELFKLRRL